MFALFTAEWLIHLPLLDFLLGFPVQLLGLFMLPYLGLRYLVDGGDVNKDVEVRQLGLGSSCEQVREVYTCSADVCTGSLY